MFLPGDITLRPGDSGEYVLELQRRLMQREQLGEGNLTSSYDGPTTHAVRDFQSLNGLLADGIAGPETLRRLISLGAVGSSSGASGDEGEQEEQREEDKERFDQYALAQEGLDKELANEAVWGAGQTTEQSEPKQTEAQAADEQQAQEAKQEQAKAVKQDVTQERVDQQRLNQHEQDLIQQQQAEQQPPAKDEQLKVTKDGIEAKNPMDDLKDKPIVDRQEEPPHQKSAEQQRAGQEQPQPDAEKSQQPKPQEPVKADARDMMASQSEQTQAQPQQQQPSAQSHDTVSTPQEMTASQPPQPATPPSPEMAATEAKLDAGSKQTTQEEGQKLNAKGVKDEGKISPAELGEMTPAQTPAVERTQQLGIG